MNRNHLWKLVLILAVLIWSIAEIFPPTATPLVEQFRKRAIRPDDNFKAIVARAEAAEKERPQRSYANLLEAIDTNNITGYFPFPEAKTETRPTSYILNRLQREAAGKIKLGIDLAGGTSFLVEMNTNQLENADSATLALSQAVEVLRKRVDKFGVAEPVIQPEGNNRILIQLPGLSEEATQNARTNIQKVAFLEFKLVHPESDTLVYKQGITVAAGYELMTQAARERKGVKSEPHRFLVKKRAEMTGGIKNAIVTRDQLGRPEISFSLDSKASDKFGQITTDNVGSQLAIILDGELVTAPNINSPITGGNGQITGDYSEQEAFMLANVLENPLKAPVQIIDERKIDPTLGSDSIRSGIRAALIGVILVSAFMLVYYLLAGVIANVALMINIIVLMGIMCSVGTTLTLPGIAGIVLTIGMAVDANVLIYERIREELAAGKSMRGALNAGYDKAFSTIFDSNLTTLISSVILIFMGTGPVKGFGVTLTIGVAVNMFSALIVTRLIFDSLVAKNYITSLKMLHIIKGAKFDFMRLAVPAFALSWLLIVVGIGYGLYRGKDVLGVEFSGGENITLSFNQAQKPGVDQIRAAAQKVSGGDLLVGYQRDISAATDTLRVTIRSFDESTDAMAQPVSMKVANQLKTEFPQAEFKVLSTDRVGPTVGSEIQKTAVIASLLAMFGILVYVAFRYEFSFAVAAVVAIIHDVLMTLGWYFLSGRELNATTVAAVLTIIGFSINDTIVIFDRIREDLKLGVRGTFREVMNKALNQTLSRTIITSGTVFLATLSLYIFGGGVINDFAFTFLIGILTGTYSSMYIAGAIVLWWHKGQRPKIGNAQMSAETVAASAQPQP
ncbi:MAG: protein translocase subunit SecD [Akkermansiaceae bacterium]|nr:protein translocase subunit SecD [Verrucomicrobiales bacterium]